MIHEPPRPQDVALALRAQVEKFRQLAALNPDDPFYAHAAEQVVAIVAGLESRAVPGAAQLSAVPQDNSGIPSPPSPGVKASSAPNQPEPPDPSQEHSGFPDPPGQG